jgi:segregation and condensation protein B
MKTPRKESESPLSLRRITEAFSQMLGRTAGAVVAEKEAATRPEIDACPISPRSIIEAILFVGRPDGSAYSAEELAGTMRDVTPADVKAAVAELNAAYTSDGAPYEIVASPAGYRLQLREDTQRLGYQLQGKVREVKLSPQALEVLAVVAYRQPMSTIDIEELRKGKSGSILAQLVRRGLLRFDRSAENSRQNLYFTTERFLRIFGLANLSQLPKAEEMDLSIS